MVESFVPGSRSLYAGRGWTTKRGDEGSTLDDPMVDGASGFLPTEDLLDTGPCQMTRDR